MKVFFSHGKLFDLIGKIGLMLITGGIAGTVFSSRVDGIVALSAVCLGVACVIIGSLDMSSNAEDL